MATSHKSRLRRYLPSWLHFGEQSQSTMRKSRISNVKKLLFPNNSSKTTLPFLVIKFLIARPPNTLAEERTLMLSCFKCIGSSQKRSKRAQYLQPLHSDGHPGRSNIDIWSE
ncbi:unnamed protein product [Clonostachys chloroleuca]|uniref:Uncharacterized protein n=1 Tax=Clonostachys chloroleuca TaxID=1926264 RepID=A0AA35Q0A7_9HYPO|nr:unnamed protein product [Clonostachys chloroleuca]